MIQPLRDTTEDSAPKGVSEAARARAHLLLRAAQPHEASAERKERVRRALRVAALKESERGRSIFSSSAVPLGASVAAAVAGLAFFVYWNQSEPPPLPAVASAPGDAPQGAPRREPAAPSREKWRVVSRVGQPSAPGANERQAGEPAPDLPGVLPLPGDEVDDTPADPTLPSRGPRSVPDSSDDDPQSDATQLDVLPPSVVAPPTATEPEPPSLPEAAPSLPAPAVVEETAPSVAAEEVSPEPAPPSPTPREEAPAPSRAAPAEERDETMLVLRATRALRADKDPAAAARFLDSYLRLYPRGLLFEEALGLAIEASAELGTPRAAVLAADYLKRFPAGRYVVAAQAALRRFK